MNVTQVDSVGQVIGTREDVGRLVWCYAASWHANDAAKPAPAPEDNDACDYLSGIPGHPFAGAACHTVPELWNFTTEGGDCAGQ